MNVDDITIEDVIWATNKLKRGKAAGPNNVPIDCYKELQEDSLKHIVALFNHWWRGGEITDAVTQAHVILLYKKGDNSNLANYRPISLLNSNYQIFTAILQKRISDALDKHLQNTQNGFRRKRGTAQALHYVQRIIEKGEMTRTIT